MACSSLPPDLQIGMGWNCQLYIVEKIDSRWRRAGCMLLLLVTAQTTKSGHRVGYLWKFPSPQVWHKVSLALSSWFCYRLPLLVSLTFLNSWGIPTSWYNSNEDLLHPHDYCPFLIRGSSKVKLCYGSCLNDAYIFRINLLDHNSNANVVSLFKPVLLQSITFESLN